MEGARKRPGAGEGARKRPGTGGQETVRQKECTYGAPSPGRGKGPLCVLAFKKVTTLYDVN